MANLPPLPSVASAIGSALPPQFDDLGNSSGLGAPAILRGTVSAHMSAGVTRGAGQTQAVRTATLAGLQAALNYAGSFNKFFEIEPGDYEIYGSAGLIVPTSAKLEWRGGVASRLIQFAANAPILTLGDTGNNGYAQDQKVSGLTLDYGVSQTGNTNANALIIGSMFSCEISKWKIGSNGTNPPNLGVKIATASTQNNFFFQNIMRDGRVYSAQTTLFGLLMSGTGNLFESLYLQNGADKTTRAALSGPALSMNIPGGGQVSDNIFDRINIEHFIGGSYTGTAIVMQTAISTTFIGLHIEDVQIGTSSQLIQQIGGNTRFIDTEVYNFSVTGASSSIFGPAGYGESCAIEGLTMRWDGQGSNVLSNPVVIVGNPSSNDSNPAYVVRGVVVQDDPGNNGSKLTLDAILTQPLLGGHYVGEYQSDNLLPRTKKYQPVITANYTHYGAHDDAVLFVPASLSAATTITLSNKRKASGTGSSLATPTGTIVRVRRQSGTYTNTLTVVDAAGGTTLATNSTAGVDLVFQFNGTNWVAAA